MAAYAIMRAKKLNSMGSVASALQHCYRERETPNADASRTPDNEHRAAQSTNEAMGRLRELLPEKRRKDAVLAVEYVMTASPEWWTKATSEQQADFFDQAHKWLADKYGADRIITATVHRDETSPHLSAFVVPLTQDGRLSAKEFIGNRSKMTADQTSFAKAVQHLGLERGIEGSKARHTRIQAFYEALERPPVGHATIEASAVQPKVLRKGF
ncbi:TPA: MobV family relaxase, partial [Klebsiella pneumoniae]